MPRPWGAFQGFCVSSTQPAVKDQSTTRRAETERGVGTVQHNERNPRRAESAASGLFPARQC